jgi:hypothetical protein
MGVLRYVIDHIRLQGFKPLYYKVAGQTIEINATAMHIQLNIRVWCYALPININLGLSNLIIMFSLKFYEY